MNSRRIIDCVMRGDKEEATRILRDSLDRKQVEATLEQSVAIAYDAIHEKFRPTDAPNVDNAADAAAAAAEQGLPDPALDPATTKEFFLKSFEVSGVPVSLKKMGLGASAPISSFVGGERWEIFMTPQQATREVKKYITSGAYQKTVDAANAAAAQAQKDAEAAEKEAEKEDKPSVKKESVELDETVRTAFKGADKNTKEFQQKIKSFGFAKSYNKTMRDFKKHAESGDGVFFIEEIPSDEEKKRTKIGNSMKLEVLPVDGNYYNLKKLGDSDEQKRGGTVYKVRLIAIKESVELDEAKSSVKSLGKDAKSVLAMAINRTTKGGPEAHPNNLDYFTPDAIDAAIKFLDKNSKKLTPAGRHAAREIVKAMKESVELDESMTFQFGTTEQASKFADEAVRQRLAATTDQYKSNYGDHMVELSSNSGSTGSPTMAHKSLVKLMKKHGGKLHSTNEGPRIKKVFSELALKEEQLDEKIKGLENKSKKSGIAYGILKKVYDRGMEAWRSGHRPGATQHQWAFARVNSFITGGKTRTTADKDLWAQHKGNKKESVQIDEATKTYKFKDFKTADAFAKACDEIVDSSDLTVNKKKNEVTVDFRRRSDEMIIDSLAKDYES